MFTQLLEYWHIIGGQEVIANWKNANYDKHNAKLMTIGIAWPDTNNKLPHSKGLLCAKYFVNIITAPLHNNPMNG